ncbi:Zinc finger protein 775 [Portunus trituberculatus]|uniref:Zinc finger protein 775 n=1 Tax=Portunus trituberculatus TaxID=210409 RepID=A0A5B7DDI8_PORTR|nr:Zinc finger protein 775 [Portunus trituberculatus]
MVIGRELSVAQRVATPEGLALTCPYCYRSTFKQTSDLKRHIRIHTGEKPFSCQYCAYSAVRREHLNDHLWRRHRILAKKRTHSLILNSESDGDLLFLQQVRRPPLQSLLSPSTPGRPLPHQQQVSTSSSLPEMPAMMSARFVAPPHASPLISKFFQCPLCPKSYDYRGSLDIHMRTHTGDAPFACPHCPLRTKDRSNLRRHIKRRHR